MMEVREGPCKLRKMNFNNRPLKWLAVSRAKEIRNPCLWGGKLFLNNKQRCFA
jgi:hypothetical protein